MEKINDVRIIDLYAPIFSVHLLNKNPLKINSSMIGAMMITVISESIELDELVEIFSELYTFCTKFSLLAIK
ncbi:hypothetical protein [Niallia sp. MER TA 168]|uniref:hypothetical protein n=1 Tax=Niallia sp. MER TA 168 TaxID=2939568 RepID=UPI00204141CC|nr:hypothetical protein [Niallia sp. MER TA 168]